MNEKYTHEGLHHNLKFASSWSQKFRFNQKVYYVWNGKAWPGNITRLTGLSCKVKVGLHGGYYYCLTANIFPADEWERVKRENEGFTITMIADRLVNEYLTQHLESA